MNRARIAVLTALVAVVTVGGSVFSVYAPEQGVTAIDLADSGVAGPNRIATCPVRVAPECAAAFSTRRYETVRFPVFREVQPDGGIALLLPPRIMRAADCLAVLDWTRCDLDPVATYPTVAARWDDAVPLTLARSASKFVIPDCRRADGGWDSDHAPVDCVATGFKGYLDGGPRWNGCNTLERVFSAGSQCLDAPGVDVRDGERMEDSL